MQATSAANLTIVGAGPAGMSVLVAACKSGQLDSLFEKRVTILEKGRNVGAGEIGEYGISSDSPADNFLRCLDGGIGQRFPTLLRHPASLALRDYRGRGVPLPLVARFISAIAHCMRDFAENVGQPVLTGMTAVDATRGAAGEWILRVRRNADSTELRLSSRHLLIATGARQSVARLWGLSVARRPMWPRHKDKLVLSGAILSHDGLEATKQHLSAIRFPRVAIIGGSHSAMATAKALLDFTPDVDWQPHSICLLHRRPLKPMYPSPEAASADGFRDFGIDDLCRQTGQVFPLAGFRSESRELLLRIMGLGGRAIEQRVELIDLGKADPDEATLRLEQADLIIAAIGYRPRALPLIDQRGGRIKLLAESPGDPVMVDDRSRVLDHFGRPIPGVFGIGLAAGFPLAGTHGEASFRGHANGVAFWQADVGEGIVKAVIEEPAEVSTWGRARLLPAMERGTSYAR